MSDRSVALRRVDDPEDAALVELSGLMHATFADPDTVLELDRVRTFLAHSQPQTRRCFRVLVAEDAEGVVGGTLFSYVPATNCGFSEYLLARKERRGQGLGRLLFEARKDLLHALARERGNPACNGLFIEADNPQRTPQDLQARERATAMDATTRLELFAHLGFLRVQIDYVQPALGAGKQPVRYLDLLFAPWRAQAAPDAAVPAAWVTETLCPIWESWAASADTTMCAGLRQRLGRSALPLVSLLG